MALLIVNGRRGSWSPDMIAPHCGQIPVAVGKRTIAMKPIEHGEPLFALRMSLDPLDTGMGESSPFGRGIPEMSPHFRPALELRDSRRVLKPCYRVGRRGW